ncbi:helix-turn-helix transcriptional regulator [Microvirga massiliensis]|uniref:helix-turn-helix transcriptional regulator n=1 Tax=Microvirga massiliensis TaxID=1033741 RepID=UPI0007C6B9DE|nr:helix-turn-helix domain-containing protein [Microvirga massiliensis]
MTVFTPAGGMPFSHLPQGILPLGLTREQAAEFIGVSVSTFDRMVEAGEMPRPRKARGCVRWDVTELVEAFRKLPRQGGEVRKPSDDEDDEWKVVA